MERTVQHIAQNKADSLYQMLERGQPRIAILISMSPYLYTAGNPGRYIDLQESEKRPNRFEVSGKVIFGLKLSANILFGGVIRLLNWSCLFGTFHCNRNNENEKSNKKSE